MFSVDSITGSLTPLSPALVSSGANGTMNVSITPTGSFVYGLAYYGSELDTFIRTSQNGQLQFTVPIVPLFTPIVMIIDSTGTHAYVSGDYNSAIYMYNLNPNTGELKTLGSGTINTPGTPRDIVIMQQELMLMQYTVIIACQPSILIQQLENCLICLLHWRPALPQ